VQERLTEQVAEALSTILRPRGVGVVIEAQHLCMMMRGVQKQNSSTITSALRGSFRSDPKTRETLTGYRKAITSVPNDAKAFLAFLDTQPKTSKRRKAGVQGYCMSGPFAIQTAATLPDRIGAVATFHGGGMATKDPNSPHLLIPRTKARFLILQAQNDDAKDPETKVLLKEAFAAAKRPATVEVYPADHGWTVPGSQVYDAVQAERAWSALLQLYRIALA